MFAESKIDFLLEINTEKYENDLSALCSDHRLVSKLNLSSFRTSLD